MRRQLISIGAVIAATFAVPSVAAAADARVTADLNMRAGPSTSFPVVEVIPDNGLVTVFGCVDGYQWCDVSWRDARGWVYADYLRFSYRNRYVPIVEYTDYVDVPVIAFSVGPYWDTYYRSRPWYDRRAYWRNVWRDHRRDARRDARIERRLERLRDRAERRREMRRDRKADRRRDAAERRSDRRDARRDRRRDERAERRLRRERNAERRPRAERHQRRREAASERRRNRVEQRQLRRSLGDAQQRRDRSPGRRGPERGAPGDRG